MDGGFLSIMNVEIESPQDPANYKDSVSKNIAVKRMDSATKLREILATSLKTSALGHITNLSVLKFSKLYDGG